MLLIHDEYIININAYYYILKKKLAMFLEKLEKTMNIFHEKH